MAFTGNSHSRPWPWVCGLGLGLLALALTPLALLTSLLCGHLCKNSWTDQGAVWIKGSDGPKESWEGAILGKGEPIVKYRNFLLWAVQKLNRSICHLGCGLRWAKGNTSSIIFARWHQCALTGGHTGATWWIRLNRPSAVAMRPYVKWLWPLVFIVAFLTVTFIIEQSWINCFVSYSEPKSSCHISTLWFIKKRGSIFVIITLEKLVWLWPPYGIGQAIIFLSCAFFLYLLSFSPPNLSRADWMSAILPHMVWP